MSVVWRSLKANLYKMYHSKLLWIHLLIPLAAVVIFNLYFWGTSWQESEAVKLYMQAVAIAFPLMIAIVTTLVHEADVEAGSFSMFLTLADRKAKGHIGNLLALLLYGSVACILTVIGFWLLHRGGTAFWEGVSGGASGSESLLPLSFYVEITWLLFGVHIVSYLLQYIMCYTFGKGVSLGLGIVGVLLSPLLYLGIGDRIWKWIPFSYGIRMVSYDFIIKSSDMEIFLNQGANGENLVHYPHGVTEQMEHYAEYLRQYVQWEFVTGAWMIAGITIFVGIVFYLWGNKWEPSQSGGE